MWTGDDLLGVKWDGFGSHGLFSFRLPVAFNGFSQVLLSSALGLDHIGHDLFYRPFGEKAMIEHRLTFLSVPQ